MLRLFCATQLVRENNLKTIYTRLHSDLQALERDKSGFFFKTLFSTSILSIIANLVCWQFDINSDYENKSIPFAIFFFFTLMSLYLFYQYFSLGDDEIEIQRNLLRSRGILMEYEKSIFTNLQSNNYIKYITMTSLILSYLTLLFLFAENKVVMNNNSNNNPIHISSGLLSVLSLSGTIYLYLQKIDKLKYNLKLNDVLINHRGEIFKEKTQMISLEQDPLKEIKHENNIKTTNNTPSYETEDSSNINLNKSVDDISNKVEDISTNLNSEREERINLQEKFKNNDVKLNEFTEKVSKISMDSVNQESQMERLKTMFNNKIEEFEDNFKEQLNQLKNGDDILKENLSQQIVSSYENLQQEINNINKQLSEIENNSNSFITKTNDTMTDVVYKVNESNEKISKINTNDVNNKIVDLENSMLQRVNAVVSDSNASKNDINNYLKQTKNIDDQIVQINTQIQKNKEDFDEKYELLKNKFATFSKTKEILEHISSELEKNQQENINHEEKIYNLSQKFDNQNIELNNIKNLGEQIKLKTKNIESNNEDLLKKFNENDQLNQINSNKVVEILKVLKTQELDIKNTTNNLEDQTKNVAILNDLVKNKIIEDMNEKFKSINTIITNLEQLQVNNNKINIEKMQKNISESNSIVENIKQSIVNLKEKISNLKEKDLYDQSININKVKQITQDLGNRIENYGEQLNNINQSFNPVYNKINNLNRVSEVLSNKLIDFDPVEWNNLKKNIVNIKEECNNKMKNINTNPIIAGHTRAINEMSVDVQKIGTIQNVLKELQKDYSGLINKVTNGFNELDNLQELRNNLSSTNNIVNNLIKKCNSKFKILEEDFTWIRKNIIPNDDSGISAFENKINTLINKNLSSLKINDEEYAKLISIVKNDINLMDQDLDKTIVTVNQNKNNVKVNSEKINNLNQSIKGVSSQQKSLLESLSLAKNNINSLNQSLEKLEQNSQNLENQYNQNTLDITNNKGKVQQNEKEISSLKEQIKSKSFLSEQNKQITSQKQEINNLKSEQLKINNYLSNLQNNINLLKQQNITSNFSKFTDVIFRYRHNGLQKKFFNLIQKECSTLDLGVNLCLTTQTKGQELSFTIDNILMRSSYYYLQSKPLAIITNGVINNTIESQTYNFDGVINANNTQEYLKFHNEKNPSVIITRAFTNNGVVSVLFIFDSKNQLNTIILPKKIIQIGRNENTNTTINILDAELNRATVYTINKNKILTKSREKLLEEQNQSFRLEKDNSEYEIKFSNNESLFSNIILKKDNNNGIKINYQGTQIKSLEIQNDKIATINL